MAGISDPISKKDKKQHLRMILVVLILSGLVIPFSSLVVNLMRLVHIDIRLKPHPYRSVPCDPEHLDPAAASNHSGLSRDDVSL